MKTKKEKINLKLDKNKKIDKSFEKILFKMIKINNDLCIILGCATPLLHEWAKRIPQDELHTYNWIMQSIEDVIYRKQPLKKMPYKKG